MSVTTRFAPSPTGDLHIGGARTALFSYLYARKHSGKFILRIEDTDLERSTDASIEAILMAMDWLSLEYDEGPIYQTDRFPRYHAVIDLLLEKDLAYRCECSKERLTALREDQIAAKQKPRYDGRCRELNLQKGDTPHVIRFKNPLSGSVVFNDLIRGAIEVSNQELDDLIIARSDGSPTYNFTVVVDDWDMNITHVIRGDDHINNTPRQINLFHALGAPVPQYAHVPMILGQDGKRLSKRHGAASVMLCREEGILPQALLNYLVRLGFAHGDQEVFSRKEMIEHFNLGSVSHSPACFDRDKLLWLNQHYLKTLPLETIQPELAWHFARAGLDIEKGPALVDLLAVQAQRCHTLVELVEKSVCFYQDEIIINQEAVLKHLTPETKPVLQALSAAFRACENWEKETLHEIIKNIAEEQGLKLGHVAQPLRVALTGDTMSPSIDSTLVLMGKARVLSRLKNYI
jgi:glutamyl-tRNA synthetase